MSRAHRPGRIFYSVPAQSDPAPLHGHDPARWESVLWTFRSPLYEMPSRSPSIASMLNTLREIALGAGTITVPVFGGNVLQPLAWGVAVEPELPPDHVEVLVSLARENREADFRDLALMVGVEKGKLDEMWSGTRRRVGRHDEPGAPQNPHGASLP